LPAQWTQQELEVLKSLSLQSLPALPPDPGNAVADNDEAAEFGHHLFFDRRLSADGNVSCAKCHQPEHHFTDQLPVGEGIAAVDRNTMTLVGAAYSPWFFWDGRKDSLWAQALEPLENPLEHGSDRSKIAALIRSDADYQQRYEQVFGAVLDQHSSDRIFANIGKVLSAYQRQLLPGPTRFDDYVASLDENNKLSESDIMTTDELAGLRLFIEKAECVNCHNGPLLTNNSFHNTAVLSAPGLLPSLGRAEGLRQAQADPFNCLGEFSDATPGDCAELRFAKGGDEMLGAQRAPSLRDVSKTAPYMHAGQLSELADVIEHYNNAQLSMIGHNEAKPLGLRAIEKEQLESFLRALNGPIATEPRWLQAPDPISDTERAAK
jgi:cytochrome c peroxidase